MSKIGRRPIVTDNVVIEIKGREIHFKGPKGSGVHVLPVSLAPRVDGKRLTLGLDQDASLSPKEKRDVNRVWGLHHALLQNKIHGAAREFEKKLKIVGLGFKAAIAGQRITFSLGYSHKIDFDLPADVTVTIDDKAGQSLTVKSSNPVKAGTIASKIRFLRLPESYKGTGIRGADEVVRRKAGKTKAG